MSSIDTHAISLEEQCKAFDDNLLAISLDQESKSAKFLDNCRRFSACRTELRKCWDAVSTGKLNAFPNIDKTLRIDEGFEPSSRQQKLDELTSADDGAHQIQVMVAPVNSIPELYECAGKASVKFKKLLSEVILDVRLPPESLQVAPLKGSQRAIEKARDDYGSRLPGPPISWLYDIVRASILCTSEDEIYGVVSHLLRLAQAPESHGNHSSAGEIDQISIIRFKNRFVHPTPGGFRDIYMNIQVPIGLDAEGHVLYHTCELQIHHKSIKELGIALHSHSVYEYFRTYFQGSVTAVEARLRLVEQLAGDETEASNSSAGVMICLRDILLADITQFDSVPINSLRALLELMCEFSLAAELSQIQLRCCINCFGQQHSKTIDWLINTGRLLEKKGDFASAMSLLLQASNVLEEYDGHDMASRQFQKFSVLDQIGSIHLTLGDYLKARDCLEKSITGKETVYGLNHPETFTSLDLSARIYQKMGDYPEARKRYEKALQGKEAYLGPNHEETIVTVHHLGTLLDKMADFGGASTLLNRSLAGKERLLGPDHAETLATVHNLGSMYFKLTNYPTARMMFERALTGRDTTLGPLHPDTLSSVHCMANLHMACNEFELAVHFSSRAIDGRTKVLGEIHAETLTSINNRGILLFRMGRYEEAKKYYDKALQGRAIAIGEDHPEYFNTLNNCGILETKLGNYSTALELFQKAANGRRDKLGSNHQSYFNSLVQLGNVLRYTRDFEVAHSELQTAFDGLSKKLGSQHANTLTAAHHLGLLYYDMENYETAELTLRSVLSGREAKHGMNHIDTLATMHALGVLLNRLGKRVEAITILQKTLDGRIKLLGADNEDSQETNSFLRSISESNFSSSLET